MATDATRRRNKCAMCSCEIAPGHAKHLWDGNDYCEGCVTKASPKLREFVENFAVLAENIVVDPREAARDMLFVFCVVGPMFIGFFAYQGIGMPGGIGTGILLGTFAIGLAALLKSWGAYRNAGSVRGRIEVENSGVKVWHPLFGSVRWPLRDCVWYVGAARDAEAFFPRLYLRRRIIIIECSAKSSRWRYKRAPCGLTDEMLEVWQAFLLLAGVEVRHMGRLRWLLSWLR